MPTNLLLLPLLGGYWFIHNLHYTRYRSQQLDGYRLLLESALAGLILMAVARVLIVFLRMFPEVKQAWLQFAPDIPYLGTAFAGLLLGAIAPHVINVALDKSNVLTRNQAYALALQNHADQLIVTLLRAMQEERFVSITLDNKKVYIGLITRLPTWEAQAAFLTLQPILSGYRNERMDLVLTVDYSHTYLEHDLNPADFPVTFPISSIRMAGYFDQSIYSSFTIEPPTEATPSPNRHHEAQS